MSKCLNGKIERSDLDASDLIPMNVSSRLNTPTPIGTLVFLRIAIGLLGAGDVLGNGIYYHWMKGAFDGFTFSYYGFEWVKPFPEPFLSLFFIVAFLLGLAVAFGWRFRVTAPLFALCFSYFFLLEKAHYLNHAYLFVWLAWLLCLTPAWRAFSLDALRKPEDAATHVPAWSVYLFPALMGVVYFWGGIAKINHDWLIEAMPLHLWLERRADMPLLGGLWAQKSTAYVMAWGGMLLDLTVAFLLLHKRLRWVALALLVGFHATNHLIFNIGIFPYLSMVLTSMFFDPDWPRRLFVWARSQVLGKSASEVFPPPGDYAADAVGVGVGRRADQETGLRTWQPSPQSQHLLIPFFVFLFAFHCYLPLRNHLFDSDVNWSEEGHRYSWRMMLRSKQGSGNYLLVDRETGHEETIAPRDSLMPRQYRKMTTHPDMILQYAHHLRDQAAEQGRDVAVYGRFRARLNGRDRHRFIDQEVDLSRTEWTWWGRKNWVLDERKKD